MNDRLPLLSSLALGADAKNDGFLTGSEVLRLKIPADLVVMSACKTGQGRIYRGEGIVGLTRAFMLAGAPRVLCSLWEVDDEATRALMIKFYELWNPKQRKADGRRGATPPVAQPPGGTPVTRGSAEARRGMGAAKALKQAQAYIRDHPDHPEWKHPYYWAAWVLWGLPD